MELSVGNTDGLSSSYSMATPGPAGNPGLYGVQGMAHSAAVRFRYTSRSSDYSITTQSPADCFAFYWKQDLRRRGIKAADNDPLIKQAVKMYCKANFGYGGSDADKFQKSYESLAVSLSLSGEYLED